MQSLQQRREADPYHDGRVKTILPSAGHYVHRRSVPANFRDLVFHDAEGIVTFSALLLVFSTSMLRGRKPASVNLEQV